MEEKVELESEKAWREERNREMVIRKKKYGKKELDRRFKEAQQKLETEQEYLTIFLQQKEKKSTDLLSDISVSKQLARMKRSVEEDEKRKRVNAALEDMNRRKEECRKIHVELGNEKLALANVRKEKKETLEKRELAVCNR